MFTLIHRRDLSRDHFEQHPAWADYSEPDDIETIVGWGVERTTVIKQLERVDYSDEFLFPVLQIDPLPSFRFLYLKADFTAADGSGFIGYILGQHPYCIAVFYGDEEFIFNINLPEFASKELARLRQASQLPITQFFPLHYSTIFHRSNGERVEGKFYYDSAV